MDVKNPYIKNEQILHFRHSQLARRLQAYAIKKKIKILLKLRIKSLKKTKQLRQR